MSRASCLVVALAACVHAGPAPELPKDPLDFTLAEYPGKAPFALNSQRGHVVMLDVWATWCEPCRQSLPVYQQLVAKHHAAGLRMYAINVDGEKAVAADIPRFVTETSLGVPILLDTDAALSESLLKVRVMPTLFLVDKQGRLRHVQEGFTPDELPAVVARVEALLAE